MIPCQKCGSKSTYQDGDAMACFMCGNRMYPEQIMGITRQIKPDEEDEMPRKECMNCKRMMSIKRHNLCATCADAGEGKQGPDLIDALAAVKARIEAGGLRKTGRNGSRKARAKVHNAEGRIPLEKITPAMVIPIKKTPLPDPQAVIMPVTLRLTVEVDVRVVR